jgi:hypothetical protein
LGFDHHRESSAYKSLEGNPMISPQRGEKLVKNISVFASFLGSFWGGLAVVSVVFPLLNSLAKILPDNLASQGGVLVWFSPELFTAIASITCFSIIVVIFQQRNGYILQSNRNNLHRLSWFSFSFGVSSILFYLLLYYFLSSSASTTLGWTEYDYRRLLGEAVLLVLYSGGFGLITRGLILLGTDEYLKRN